MLVDCRELDNNSLIECDIAVIGGGMAGICIARELRDAEMSVCIFESGGEEQDAETNELSKGSANIHSETGKVRVIDDYVHESRRRYLGGTGNAWGGKCAEFEMFDFAERNWIAGSGWPIDFSTIRPYYDRACYMLHIPTFSGIKRNASEMDSVDLNFNRNFNTVYRTFTGITGDPQSKAFKDYKYGITRFPNTRVYLYANISNLNADRDEARIGNADIKCINGKTHSIKAKLFILAAGGIENVRILLNSNSIYKNGIGNEHDLVGRFFNGHGMFRYLQGPQKIPCIAHLDEDFGNHRLYTDKNPGRVQGVYNLSRKAQWRERICNFSVTLDPAIVADDGSVVNPIFFMLEQFPNMESRIQLSGKPDALGMPRVHIDWRFSERDVETLVKGIKLFNDDLVKSGKGYLSDLELGVEVSDIIECSRHHIGCTRMHSSSRSGVVDQDCKVHDMDNLYIAGSSVFTTGGIANPTLTIMALAIRLADHIKARYSRKLAILKTSEELICS